MSLLKELLFETRKITEADLFPDEQVAPAEVPPTEEVVAEEPVEEVPEDIEITDELIAELAEANPAISEADPVKFKAGLENEIKFLEVLGGDINVVANLVLAHINEFPDKDYYAALTEMENCLSEEGCEETPVEGEAAVEEVPAEGSEPAFIEEEEVVEEGKETGTSDTKQPDGKAMSQVKNESTTPEEKKDEKEAAAADKKEKAEEVKLKAEQKADDKVDMNKKDVNPIKVTPRA